jgi:hypothetical protein
VKVQNMAVEGDNTAAAPPPPLVLFKLNKKSVEKLKRTDLYYRYKQVE